MNAVVWALQMFAVDLATAILSGLGIAYEVSGDQILARQHTFQVIETCSGMRSLETLTIAAVAYCELFGRHGRRLWALVLSAPVIALLLNGVRVVTIILNPYSEVVAIHTLQGLVIIVLGVFAIAGVDSLFERLGWFPGGAARMLRVPREVPFHGLRWTALGAFLALLAVASIVPLTASSPAPPIVPLMQRVPAVVGEWSSVPAKIDQGFLGSVYYTQMLRRDYKRGDDVISLFAAEDDRQQPAASMLSPKSAIGDTGWDTTDRSRVRVGALDLERLVLRRGPAQRQLVYYWLEGERPFGTEFARAAFALDRNPRRHSEPIRAARLAIRFDATIPRAEESAEQQLQQFVRELAHAELFAATPP
jgi:exosortase/archaeosortase family protein